MKGVCPAKHPLRNYHQWKVALNQNSQNRGDADGDSDRGVNDKEEEKR